jgi:hypothetical protein
MDDMTQVVAAIKGLSEEECLETSLCLLNSLLPFQLRLSALASQDEPSHSDVVELNEDFHAYLVRLRDGLLGA